MSRVQYIHAYQQNPGFQDNCLDPVEFANSHNMHHVHQLVEANLPLLAKPINDLKKTIKTQ